MEIIKETGRNLKLLLDIFHQAKEQKNLVDAKLDSSYQLIES
jgi:sugar phosphate isomerase/epimerase